MNRLIVGQPLYTKDGRVHPNGIVVRVNNNAKPVTYLIKTNQKIEAVFTWKEILDAFYLRRPDEDEQVPTVNILPGGGGALSVTLEHGENIQKIIPTDLYQNKVIENLSIFTVTVKNWDRFSEMLCLGDDI